MKHNNLSVALQAALDAIDEKREQLIAKNCTGKFSGHSYEFNDWLPEDRTEYENLGEARLTIAMQKKNRDTIDEGYQCKDGDRHTDFVEMHPSYGVVRVTRPQGGSGKLFDSAINHDHFISLTISRAERHRSLARNWIHSKEELMEINLSFDQWARVVSGGSGEECPITISRYQGEMLEPPEQMNDRTIHMDEFNRELRELQRLVKDTMQDSVDRLKQTGTITKAERAVIAGRIEDLIQRLGKHSGFSFLGKQYMEFAENIDQQIKSDAESWLQRLAEAKDMGKFLDHDDNQ